MAIVVLARGISICLSFGLNSIARKGKEIDLIRFASQGDAVSDLPRYV